MLYEVITEQQIVDSIGELKRLSIAVIVDGVYQDSGQPNGQKTFVPRNEQELAQIRNNFV